MSRQIIVVSQWQRIAAACWLVAAAVPAVSGQYEQDDPALRAPLLDRKIVMAHYMTTFVPATMPRLFTTANYTLRGEIGHLGGQIAMPMYAYYAADQSLEQQVEFEIRTAKKMGVDCFAFYYPCPVNAADAGRYNQVIKTFLEVLERRPELDFKVTLCPSHPAEGIKSRPERVDYFVRNVADLLATTRNARAWLRTPDGRLLFSSWAPYRLADVDADSTPEDVAKVAAAYRLAADKLGIRLAVVYHLTQRDLFAARNKQVADLDAAYRRYVDAVLDHFPGVTGFLENPCYETHRRSIDEVVALCSARGRTYAAPLMPSMFFHKLTSDSGKLLHNGGPELADKSRGPDRYSHHDFSFNLSEGFRRQLEIGVRAGTLLWNLNTWNDYHEGHALAPEVNHNFGFDLLLQYYKARWLDPAAAPARDVAIAFFKKYPRAAVPAPYRLRVTTPTWICTPAYNESAWAREDAIEVVTILREPGELTINRTVVGMVPAGLTASRIPIETGPVHVVVKRGGVAAVDFTTPEWITDRPFRTDRETYAFSSECRNLYADIFAQFRPKVMHTAVEYAGYEHGLPAAWTSGEAEVGFLNPSTPLEAPAPK